MSEEVKKEEIKEIEKTKNENVLKNKTNIYCSNCKEIIAKSGVAEITKSKQNFEGFVDLNDCESWWVLKDMFHFENIGFTKIATKKNYRFLCCASCEKEAIGFCVDGEQKYYISSDKVIYKKE